MASTKEATEKTDSNKRKRVDADAAPPKKDEPITALRLTTFEFLPDGADTYTRDIACYDFKIPARLVPPSLCRFIFKSGGKPKTTRLSECETFLHVLAAVASLARNNTGFMNPASGGAVEAFLKACGVDESGDGAQDICTYYEDGDNVPVFVGVSVMYWNVDEETAGLKWSPPSSTSSVSAAAGAQTAKPNTAAAPSAAGAGPTKPLAVQLFPFFFFLMRPRSSVYFFILVGSTSACPRYDEGTGKRKGSKGNRFFVYLVCHVRIILLFFSCNRWCIRTIKKPSRESLTRWTFSTGSVAVPSSLPLAPARSTLARASAGCVVVGTTAKKTASLTTTNTLLSTIQS